jgi:hypothetical protein
VRKVTLVEETVACQRKMDIVGFYQLIECLFLGTVGSCLGLSHWS